MKRKIWCCLLMILLTGFFLRDVYSESGYDYTCGIAVGFPPYQYADRSGRPAGLDYEIAKLVFDDAGLKIRFVQDEWDAVLFSLAHRTGRIDLLCGTEISDERRKFLDFSDVCYTRYISLFVMSNSGINDIQDLYGKLVAGDRHSFVENHLQPHSRRIRIIKTPSKEDSFMKLREGKVQAVIAPRQVGFSISRKSGMNVRTIGIDYPGSAVAFAAAKGDSTLLSRINGSLRRLKKKGRLDEILQKY
ncbi:MAG: transporter substrate-binding domain-containing protein [Spirochaetota bacterium]